MNKMSMLYTNENFPLGAVYILRRLGHDVVTTHDAGQSNRAIPDDQVVQFAINESRIVVTFNRKDFIKIHNINNKHFGIVVCSVDTDLDGLAHRIDDALKQHNPARGKLIRVNKYGFRAEG